MTNLNATQIAALATAAGRPDGTLLARGFGHPGDAAAATAKALVARGLLEHHRGAVYRITAAGRAAVQAPPTRP